MEKITLKAARANVNLSRPEAAKKIGVSTDTLFNWEKGKTFPTVPQIAKIEEAYNVKYSDLSFFV